MTHPLNQLSVDIIDQLTIDQDACKYQPMVDTQEIREAFAARLNAALDDVDSIRKSRGRNVDFCALMKKQAPGFGSSTQATHKWLKAESMPEKDNMRMIARVLNVRAEWLEYGEGPMRSGGSPEITGTELEPVYQPSQIRRYPVINEVQAGEWAEICEQIHLDDTVEMQETTADAGPDGFWLRVKNDSMTSPSGKSFPEGMLVLVNPNREVLPGSFVVAKLDTSNEATFKQYIHDGSGHYLKPLNKDYDMIRINGNCRFVGRVIEAKWADL